MKTTILVLFSLVLILFGCGTNTKEVKETKGRIEQGKQNDLKVDAYVKCKINGKPYEIHDESLSMNYMKEMNQMNVFMIQINDFKFPLQLSGVELAPGNYTINNPTIIDKSEDLISGNAPLLLTVTEKNDDMIKGKFSDYNYGVFDQQASTSKEFKFNPKYEVTDFEFVLNYKAVL